MYVCVHAGNEIVRISCIYVCVCKTATSKFFSCRFMQIPAASDSALSSAAVASRLHPNEPSAASSCCADSCHENLSVKPPQSAVPIQTSTSLLPSSVPGESSTSAEFVSIPNQAVAIVRLFVMSYFPCGFWPRLITRLLGDSTFGTLADSLYNVDSLPHDLTYRGSSSSKPAANPSFRCWQNGVELFVFGTVPVLRISEVSLDPEASLYRRGRIMTPHEPDMRWLPVDMREVSILEIVVANETVSVVGGSSSTLMYPVVGVTAALMSRAVDRVDTLLEDWYPDIGARFVQNTRGTYLITRLVPCTRCLLALQGALHPNKDSWMLLDSLPRDWAPSVFRPVLIPTAATPPSSPSASRQSSVSSQTAEQARVANQSRYFRM